GSVSYSGAATESATAQANGLSTPATVNVTSTTAGNRVAGFCCEGASFVTATAANQVKRYLINGDTSSGAGNSSGEDAPAGGTVTMSYNVTDEWGIVAFEVQASSGTNATAGATSGTGTAPQPTLTLASNAAPGAATASGTAPGITAQVAFSAIAGLA